MRERVKSLVLLVLVLSSIVLTGRLLFGLPALETAPLPAYEKLVFGDLRPPARAALPELRLNEGSIRVLRPWESGYEPAWEMVRWLVTHSREVGRERWEEQAKTDGMALEVIFPFPVTPQIWGAPFAPEGGEITAIAWYESNPESAWYRESGGGWQEVKLEPLPPKWPEELRGAFAGSLTYVRADETEWAALGLPLAGEVLLPASLPVLAPRTVVQEPLDQEKLLRSIFVDMALVRRIEERAGAFIYTDGQRGLRLFDHGEVEYSSPKSEPGSENMEKVPALRRTAQYLQLMGGWPEHLFIQDLVAQSGSVHARDRRDTYTVTFFSAQHGVRLLGHNFPVKLRFSDRGVISYNRQVKLLEAEVGEKAVLVDPRQAALAVVQALAGEEAPPLLKDVFVAYYLREPGKQQAVSHPVWAFVFSDGRVAAVYGHSGQLVTWL